MGEGAGMGKGTLWGMIDAQPIYFPAAVDELNAATLVFSVPSARARSHVPEEHFEVVESQPGTTHLIITAHHYVRAAWGSSETLDLGFRARPVGGPDESSGLFLCPAPMSPSFGREATHRALGFPKTDGDVSVHYSDDSVTFTHGVGSAGSVGSADGTPDFLLRLPRVRPNAPPAPVALVAYTCADGEPKVAPFTLTMPIGIIPPDGVRLELGTGPMAEMLRALGLPRVPDLALWAEGASAVFNMPAPIRAVGTARHASDRSIL
jgi:hypothetical protein